MAATGFTPIQLYRTTTAAAVPVNTNLADGELAINTTDERLFFKNAAGVVKVIAGTGGSGVVAGSNTQVQFNNNGVFGASANLTFDGTALTLGGNPTISSGTANGVAYLNGSKVLTTGSALTFDGTNLGIGVSSPGAKLDVANGITRIQSGGSGGLFGNDNTSYTLFQASQTANAAAIYLNGQARSGFQSQAQYGASAHVFLNETLGTERMRIDSSGNVGIGTSSPTAKLDVNGITQSRGNIYGGTFNAVANIIAYSSVAAGGAGSSQFLFGNTSSETRGYLSYNHANDNLLIGTTGTTKATLDSSGNLGLGITPSAWASTSKAIQIGTIGFLENNNNASQYFGRNAYRGTAGGWIYSTSSFAQLYGMENSGNYVWYNAPSGTAGNAISFTQAMTLDASGNLLVGTTSNQTGAKVNAAGGVGVSNTATSRFASVEYGNGAFGTYSTITVSFTVNSGTSSVILEVLMTGFSSVYLDHVAARYSNQTAVVMRNNASSGTTVASLALDGTGLIYTLTITTSVTHPVVKVKATVGGLGSTTTLPTIAFA